MAKNAQTARVTHWIRNDEITLTWCDKDVYGTDEYAYDGGTCPACVAKVDGYMLAGNFDFGSIRNYLDSVRN